MSIESQAMRSRIVVRQVRKGANGSNGWTAVIANIKDGERFVMQVVNWIGGQGTKPDTGQYIGESGFVENISEAVDIRGVGQKGWSPILSVIIDGDRRVLQVFDWTGGEGEMPEAGMYIGPYGFVSDIALAIDIRGGSAANYAPGDIVYIAASAIPSGRRLLKANGTQNLSRTAYADLFAVIGTRFGAGDGTTTFGIPDLRGEFIRGFDDGRGVDTGRVFGSAQSHLFAAHTHNSNLGGGLLKFDGSNNIFGYPVPGSEVGSSGGLTTVGGSETRPRNIALLACIAY